MLADLEELEGIADELLSETGCDDPPVDALELADLCGFRVEPARSRTSHLDLEHGVIRVDVRQRRERMHMSITHELGHWLLRTRARADSEDGARYLGGALLLPRRAFSEDLRRTAWALAPLRERHRNASATAIAVRITQLRDAVVTVLDPHDRLYPWRVASPWLADPGLKRVSRWERELARAAYEEQREVRGDELCYAVPLLDGSPDEHRVLVVCEAEQLSSRL